ncbi:MAG: TonB-dependent receptor [Phaeodactylibacter sp.]|nr:TonB-dependent receptor [Phaeodactylibacter sp.]MCB9265408.1 TonB-dependent receptor [Lewinellaceae bacterium]MCB9289825.1 TonB-dependent receptor [Lewinellaceae bacterium]
MKKYLNLLFFVLIGAALHGQAVLEKGTVSFVSSRNVYVKFSSTENINIGDTLFVDRNGKLIPVLEVNNKSSTSTVCTPLLSEGMEVSQEVIAKTVRKKEIPEPKKENAPPAPPQEKEVAVERANPVITPEEEEGEALFRQKVRGRASVASYSNFSDYQNLHRMRYAFSFRGENLNNSRFSTDSYITFRHTLNEWEQVKENLGNALKVYALSVKYDFTPASNLTLGRKINPRMSSVGAIDGLQYEQGVGNFIFGAIAGSRPDYSDYSFNLNLLQVGAYASYVSAGPAKFQQTTFGFLEQRNKSEVDRRFVYFQHSGELMDNLHLFGSFEVDLFEKINNEAKNALRLTNMFVSLRYRLSRNWRVSVSYDNRKNIIYYESYKSFIDRLIEDETRQGLRFGVNYRPFNLVTVGANASWRFQKNGSNLSKNLNTYVNISRLPLVNARLSLTANFLQTNYLNSRIFGARLSKDIIKRRLNGDLYYRNVNYLYGSNETAIRQNIAGASLSLVLMKHLTMYLYYEGTFDDKGQTLHRFNSRLIQRF